MGRAGRHGRRAAALAIGLAALLMVADAPDPGRRFFDWRLAHRAEVDAYARFLDRRGVGGAVPLPELLRTGRSWRKCGDEFAVPPPRLWPAMVPTLRLLGELRRRGLLAGEVHVDSTWRGPAFNACAGGAPRSRHLGNGALDLEWRAPAGAMARLCTAWESEGARWHWGLGFYSPTRLHLDTGGFRTWGTDHHYGTSLCARPADG
jgi:hypothetical protein